MYSLVTSYLSCANISEWLFAFDVVYFNKRTFTWYQKGIETFEPMPPRTELKMKMQILLPLPLQLGDCAEKLQHGELDCKFEKPIRHGWSWAQSVPADYQRSLFITCIRQDALEVVNLLPYATEEDWKGLNRILELLNNQMIGEEHITYERDRFYQQVQGEHE